MTRRLLIALLAVFMTVQISGCSSGSSKDDTEVAESNDETFAEEGEGDFADDSSTQTADASESTSTEESADPSAEPTDGASDVASEEPKAEGDDLALDGADQAVTENSETSTTTETTETAQAAPTDELSLDEPLPNDVATNGSTENITDNPATPSDAGVFQEPSAETAQQDVDAAKAESPVADAPVEAPTETTTDVASNTQDTSVSDSYTPPKPVVYAPYLKVKDAAFTAPGGETMNRVYLARPKDTAKSISTKLYGDATRSRDLTKWNPILKRGVRTGDKIYYSSAANPSDTRMMTYFEEAGLAPQSYVSKDGDNIRTVSKSLLGFNDAWKEVWATNANVESKGDIPAGLEIRYWPESTAAVPVQTMASTSTPEISPTEMAPTDPGTGLPSTLPDAAPTAPPASAQASGQVPNEMPPSDPFASAPPQQVQPMNGQAVAADTGAGVDPLAPPPPIDSMAPPVAAGTVGTDPMAPPPPSAQAQATPPPPAVVAKPKKPVAVAAVDEEATMDEDTTMALGVGGVLLVAAAILFVLIRKNRAKRMDLGQTQV